MKKMKCVVAIMMIIIIKSNAQDPSFAQFFSSPLNINPALTGNINADWRAISNFRDQWIGPASPYATGTISYDRKIHNAMSSVSEKNGFRVGGMLMFDYAMAGVQKSTYFSMNLAYNVVLSDNINKHSIAVGFGAIYGRRYIDFSRLDFEEQFTGYGFDVNRPTGEAALSNMKSYISSSAGLTYSIKNEKSNIDIGVAAFHLNKPKQTFLEDEHQYLAMRKVAHVNFEKLLNDRIILNANAIYQFQLEAKYYSVGAALGYIVGDAGNTILNGGLWYWSNNAVTPYVGLAYKDLQFGFSYDWTVSKLREAVPKPKTFEISIILRGVKDPTGIIHCPWK
ncbi:MAG TPA: PorP/SprF family type IX secretion system membrane protein [Chitinophagaceae bacterium]|nr:PorP/SprF family type IX secretion system membrane protein [Chitinophagaceae bacterium]